MSGVSVSHYLSGMAETIKSRDLRAIVGQFPFVTISRQTGAGGNTLARELIRQINAAGDKESDGWAIFDEAMCESILDHPQLSSMLQGLLDEQYRNSIQEFVHTLAGGTAQDLGYTKLAEVQRQVATLGKVIFVGSGATCVTRNLPMGAHVRLVASLEDRQKRIADLQDIDVSDAAREIERSDRDRERLTRNHFTVDSTDPANYDVTWNTSRVSFEHIAQSILALIHARM